MNVRITAIGARGDGIAAREPGELVRFVPYTLPDELVEVAGEGARLMLERVVEASPERVAPVCPHFTHCGGCALQHWALAPYMAWKRDQLAQVLADAGLSTEIRPIIDAHGAGRRRVTLHARKAPGGYTIGFNAAREHRVIAIDACPLLAPALPPAFALARHLTSRLGASGAPIDYQMTATDNGLDVDVRGIPAKARPSDKTLIALADRPELARLTWHGQLVLQRAAPTIAIDGSVVTLPPAAFLQATEMAQEVLARLTVEAVGSKPGRMADLFCGVGTLSLPLSRLGAVHAVDSSAEAVKALADAGRFLIGRKPLTTEVRDLFRRPLLPADLKRFDTVVFDPPRAGAEAQAQQLAASKIARVVAVSCNPQSFAVDALHLTKAGFRLVHVTPVDQFRWSAHVELVALFER